MNRIKHLIGKTGWEIEPEKEFDAGTLLPCDDPEWGVLPEFNPPPATSLIRELAERLSGNAAENDILRERIDELTEQVGKLTEQVGKQGQQLKELFAPSTLPEAGAFEEWLASGESVNPFRGKHVVFVPGKGVVASSDSLDELFDEVDAMGKIQGLAFGFVPVASVSISKC